MRLITLNLFFLVSLLAGCTGQFDVARSSSSPCEDASVSAECILELAQSELDKIEDDYLWAASAIELVVAYDENKNSSEAWQVIQQVLAKTRLLDADKSRETLYGELLSALESMQKSNNYFQVKDQLGVAIANVKDEIKRLDLMGKLLVFQAAQGQYAEALAQAIAMPETTDAQKGYKARTLKDVSMQIAKQGDFEVAVSAARNVDMSMPYYRAVALADIARLAIASGDSELAMAILQEAESLGRAEENGYFRAGALRDVACGYVLIGERNSAVGLINDARSAARVANSPNERARSMSRIATKLADCGLNDYASEIISEAIALAETIEDASAIKNYSYYEIAGSAAFSAQYDVAEDIVNKLPSTAFGNATSLLAASQRDLAWGVARGGNVAQALEIAKGIGSPREKIHALSRLVRIVNNPNMDALPRYL